MDANANRLRDRPQETESSPSSKTGSFANGHDAQLVIGEEKKVDIVLAQLAERYSALHCMRDRSMQFTLWILGFGLGMAWLILSEVVFSSYQAALGLLFLLVMGAASLFFLRGIHIGFNNNMAIAARLESTLGLFQSGLYHRTMPILNGDFARKSRKPTGHFVTLYFLMGSVYTLLIIMLLVNPNADRNKSGASISTAYPPLSEGVR
jgi:hypothetical protein